MVCTFIGHRNAPFSVKESLENEILALINQGVQEFYVGNNGYFDLLVQEIMFALAPMHKGVRFEIVLSALNEKTLTDKPLPTVFPEELAKGPKKFAMCKRNDYMIKKSSFVIAYATNTFSNSFKFIQKAQKRGCTVINLAEKPN